MPLPIIAAGMVAAAVAGGTGSGALGFHRRRTAKDVDAEARKTYDNAKRLYLRSERLAESAALDLGHRKIETMARPMKAFHEALLLFRNLDFKPEVAHDPLPEVPFDAAHFDDIDFDEWQRIATLTTGGVVVAGKASGAAVTTSAATTALALGGATASTGTAIGALSGAAATNATLAWFGGGSLAAGGWGMAGGTMVLGGIAVAPVALVGGVTLLLSGNKALDQARANEELAKTAAAQSKAARTLLEVLTDRATWCERVIADLAAALSALVPLVRSSATRQPDARKLSDAEKELVVAAFRTSQVISELVALNIVWRGRITAKSAAVLSRAERFLEHGRD